MRVLVRGLVVTLLLTWFAVALVGCHSDSNSCTAEGDACSSSDECCGDDLCIGYLCEPPTFCVATGDGCSIDYDCCGAQTFCVNNICADSCLSGADCVSGCCAPTTTGVNTCADTSYCTQCLPLLSGCSNTSQCCAPLLCAPTPDAFLCCVQSGGSCALHDDCCGTMLCYGGVCG